jgi:hypothetical protein
MHLHNRLLSSVHDEGSLPIVSVLNKHRLVPLALTTNKEVVKGSNTSLIPVPILKDKQLTLDQIDMLLIQLLKSCPDSSNKDVLIDNPEHWRTYFASIFENYQEIFGVSFKKIAVVGGSTAKLEEVLKAFLSDFQYIELFEHPALKNDSFVIPLDIPCGTIVYRGKNKKQTIGMVLYETCVRRLSFHLDDELKQFSQYCSEQE